VKCEQLKVKQGGCDLHIIETSKVCEVQGGAYIASRSLRNRLKPDVLFFTVFFAIFCRKKRHIEYILVVCSRFFVMFDLAERRGI